MIRVSAFLAVVLIIWTLAAGGIVYLAFKQDALQRDCEAAGGHIEGKVMAAPSGGIVVFNTTMICAGAKP